MGSISKAKPLKIGEHLCVQVAFEVLMAFGAKSGKRGCEGVGGKTDLTETLEMAGLSSESGIQLHQ